MNLFLSIFLCFALALGGGAELPAEPETAATWTIRNVHFANEDYDITLGPEARISAAVGSERAALQFSIVNNGKEFFPFNMDVTNDALRFSLSNNSSWAYSISDATFREFDEFTETDLVMLDVFAAALVDYGALYGAIYDEARESEIDEAVFSAWAAGTGAEIEDTEVEIGGQALPARRIASEWDFETLLTLIDALGTCDIDEVEAFAQSALPACLLLLDTEAETYSDLYDQFCEDFAGLTAIAELIYAREGDIAYGLVLIDAQNLGEPVYYLRQEITVLDGETTVVQDEIQGDRSTSSIRRHTGSRQNPDTLHMEYAMTASGDEPSSMSYTLDSAAEDGLRSASGTFEWIGSDDYMPDNLQMSATVSERREADGSATAEVAIDLIADGKPGTVTFELNRAEGEYADPFEGRDIREITNDVIDGADGFSVVTASMAADAAQLSLDAMQLMNDEGVAALVEWFEDADDYEIEEVYVYQQVETLEEAAEIYEGELPAYTAPEGYEIEGINVLPQILYIKYVSTEHSFQLSTSAYLNSTRVYQYFDSSLMPADGYSVLISADEDDFIYSAMVYPADGKPFLHFYFDGVTMDELAEILSGLENK